MPYLHSLIEIFQWNANGLRQRSGNVCQFLKQNNIPILALTKVYMNDDFGLSIYVQHQSSCQKGQSQAITICTEESGISAPIFFDNNDHRIRRLQDTVW